MWKPSVILSSLPVYDLLPEEKQKNIQELLQDIQVENKQLFASILLLNSFICDWIQDSKAFDLMEKTDDFSMLFDRLTWIKDIDIALINTHINAMTAFDIFEINSLESKDTYTPPLFSKTDIHNELCLINSLPHTEWPQFINEYYNRFVKPHDYARIFQRYWIVDVLENQSWKIHYKSAIVCWTVIYEWEEYGVIWHDKHCDWGRATPKDHLHILKYLDYFEEKWTKVVFIADTPWANSGKDANENHQAKIMSEILTKVSTLTVPSMTILLWEWGSWWAEIFMGSDLRYALNDAYFSTIHPVWLSNIKKWAFSAKTIAWLQKLDTFNLYKYGIVDWVINTNAERKWNKISDFSRNIFKVVSQQFTQHGNLLQNYGLLFQHINEEQTADTIRDNIKKARIYRSSTRMLEERPSLEKTQESLGYAEKYEDEWIKRDFNEHCKSNIIWEECNKEDFNNILLTFFRDKLKTQELTKYSVVKSVYSLIEDLENSILPDIENSLLEQIQKVEMISFIREELYSLSVFMRVLTLIINPRNYRTFFEREEHSKSQDEALDYFSHLWIQLPVTEKWMYYSLEKVTKNLEEIYASIPLKYVQHTFANWKRNRFKWMVDLISDDDNYVWFESIVESFRIAHPDLPKTINSLWALLIHKFWEAISNEKWFNWELREKWKYIIDYSEKSEYEKILFFKRLIKLCWNISISDIESTFLDNFHDCNSDIKKPRLNPVEGEDNLETSIITWFWNLKWVEWNHAIIMTDPSINCWAIDGAWAKKILLILDEATWKNKDVFMFFKSGWIYVDGWPEAVTSMTALNRWLADYNSKTWKKAFAIGFWVVTWWTIAWIAQSPFVNFIPLSLTDILFAWRIVTTELLPIECTLADFQIRSKQKPHWIETVLRNPFIKEEIYKTLNKKYDLKFKMPKWTLSQYLISEQWLKTSWEPNDYKPKAYDEIELEFKENKELFRPFTKVAILNSWTIAKKAQDSIEWLWLEYIQFYTSADQDQDYVKNAKNKIKIDSYICNYDAIINKLIDHWADAIYLWFGYYSENAEFIYKCEEAWIVVIWAKSETVYKMGDKLTARKTVEDINSEFTWRIISIPKWSDNIAQFLKETYNTEWNYIIDEDGNKVVTLDWEIQSKEAWVLIANIIGYPVILKSRFWGWWKWIKIVENDDEILNSFDLLSNEARSAFWNGAIYMEKAYSNQRHIEVQIYWDTAWNIVSMWLRDCSPQRRKQKIIEQCWNIKIPNNIREILEDSCRKLASKIGYVWAWTVEFLYSDEDWAKFMEMNTRIQVEHPITEHHINTFWTFNKQLEELNLVDLQLKIASWMTWILPDQNSIDNAFYTWHTAEVRICAEDPVNNFQWIEMAKITSFIPMIVPSSLKHKFVTFVKQWPNTWSHTWKWDSNIIQLIVSWGSKEWVRRWLVKYLKALRITWIPTNIGFLINILESKKFKNTEMKTNTIDSSLDEYLDWLIKFNEPIKYITENKEDYFRIEEDEYLVRSNKFFLFYNRENPDSEPYLSDWEALEINGNTPFYQEEIMKVYWKKCDLGWNWVYAKNYKWEQIELMELWKIQLTNSIPNNWTYIHPWSALFVIKKM